MVRLPIGCLWRVLLLQTDGVPVHDLIETWPVNRAAAGWIDRAGRSETTAMADQAFHLASVTKPLFAYAVLVAVEEGTLALDQPIPNGTSDPLATPTIADLLAHASGLGPDEPTFLSPPHSRRIYSNAGFELLGQLLATASGFPEADYFHEAVVQPLGLQQTVLHGSPAHSAVSCVDDLLRFGAELLAPTLISPQTLNLAVTPHLPTLGGILPGYGRQSPNEWGLGFEVRGQKSPHWTAPSHHPSTFGHFGRAGTMFWVDPVAGVACTALTDRDFGSWAIDAWPRFNEQVLANCRAA